MSAGDTLFSKLEAGMTIKDAIELLNNRGFYLVAMVFERTPAPGGNLIKRVTIGVTELETGQVVDDWSETNHTMYFKA